MPKSAIEIMLRECAAFSLDVSVFSAIAGSSARPAGLLAGVAALPAAAATAGKEAAMSDDLAALAQAIAPATANIVFVGHPSQINAIKVRRGTAWDPSIPLWSTIGIAQGTLIALDPAGIVSAFGTDVEVRASREAEIHFEDTNPAAIASGGTMASPVGSVFQSDSIALQLRLRAAWCLRVPGAIAWVSGVSW